MSLFDCLAIVLLCRIFWNLPYLSYQVVFQHDRKSQSKNINILRRNGAFKMKLKALFIVFYRSFTEANKTNFLGR